MKDKKQVGAVNGLLSMFAPTNPRQFKLNLALGIMGFGMALAMAWAGLQLALGRSFPYDTFLFNSNCRFSDLADSIIAATLPNSYADPFACYPPFAFACLRPLASVPESVATIMVLFLGLGTLFVFLVAGLDSIVAGSVARVGYVLLAFVTAYPVLICFDRANIEIIVAALIGGAVWFMCRAQFTLAALCLAPAIALKFYPVLLLALFLRRREIPALVGTLLVALVLTVLSIWLLGLPVDAWSDYQRNFLFFTRIEIFQNFTLDCSGSLWNAFKLALVIAAHFRWIAPVDFSFDGRFIHMAYLVYSSFMLLLFMGVVLFACLVERQLSRAAILILIFMAVGDPRGCDYRMIYGGFALLLLIASKGKRAHDFLALVLLALTLVPKREIILGFVGRTESGFANVSTDVLVNPVLIFGTLFFLLYETPLSRRLICVRWSRLIAAFPAMLKNIPPRSFA